MTGKTCSLLMNRGMFVLMVILWCASTSSAEWKEKVLYSFQEVPDGASPTGALVFDKAGNLYGATADGGASACDSPGECGTVYQLARPAKNGDPWKETVLYVFKGHAENDGATPEGGLVIDEAGNLYGVTGYGGDGSCTLLGGAVGCGTVYELSPPAKQGDPWTETVLYSLKGGKDGYVAIGDLVFDKAGNLYGATLFGGGKGTTCDSLYGGQCGTVFELSPPKTTGGKWTERVLHSFAGGTDGADPTGGLVLNGKGAIYGTTQVGGYHQGVCDRGNGYEGCGTVFALKPPAQEGGNWSESVLWRFEGTPNDGLGPNGRLALDSSGSLYGTTIGGGGYEDGVVFELNPPIKNGNRWKESLIHVFTGAKDGQGPWAGLVQGATGSFYGSAGGSPSHGGLLFEMKPPTGDVGTWSFDVICSFTGSPYGYDPLELTIVKGGAIFGVTLSGGSGQACQGGCGTVFRAAP
jgi:uncharacterized repeat protein (TIGR03803 family)